MNKCFWNHNWDKWTVIEQGVISWVKDNTVIGHYLTQERKCKDCNKTELNEQRTD